LIPVTVLTGALGAGKTTLLNAVLRTCDEAGPDAAIAVVVNEFGAVGIDHALVEAASEAVVLLPGGCACCAVRADLADAFRRLELAARDGRIQPFRRIVLETSGLAEPGPILQFFAERAALSARFRLEAIVTVTDALLAAAALDAGGSARRQVELADRLLVTKWEAADPAALAALDARLAKLNPFAEVVHARARSGDPAWFNAVPLRATRAVPPYALTALHDDAVESFVLAWSVRPALPAIGAWLDGLAQALGARLLRVKGIVAAEGVDAAIAIHAVQHLVGAPDRLPQAPPATSRVVFIVRGLEPGDVLPPWPCAVETPAPAQPQRAATAWLATT
jgi:G3E family GTPase